MASSQQTQAPSSKFTKRGKKEQLNKDLTFDKVQINQPHKLMNSAGEQQRLFTGTDSSEHRTVPGGEATPAFEQTPRMTAANQSFKAQQYMDYTTPAQHKIWHHQSSSSANENIRFQHGGSVSAQPAQQVKDQRVIATGPQRFQYEYMPQAESEIDSARLTVDYERNRQPTKTLTHMNRDAVDPSKSDATLRTLEKSGVQIIAVQQLALQDATNKKHQLNSASVSQPAAEDRSVMTTIVVNDPRLEEQEKNDTDNYYQDALNLQLGQTLTALDRERQSSIDNINPPISSFVSNTLPQGGSEAGAGDSHREMQRMLRDTHQQQSQSLEQLHGGLATELRSNLEQQDNSDQLTGYQQHFNLVLQNRNKTISYQQDALSTLHKEVLEDDHRVNQSQNSTFQRVDVARNLRSTTTNNNNVAQRRLPSSSEFAITEANGQDLILVASQHQPDDNISITVQGGSNVSGSQIDRADRGSQAIQDSVTDAHTILDSQMQFAPKVLESSRKNEEVLMSVTENAKYSPRESFDARQSEIINVGPFEEENSVDWRRERASLNSEVAFNVVKDQPSIERSILATDPLPKEMSNLNRSEKQASQQNEDSHEQHAVIDDNKIVAQVAGPIQQTSNDYCLPLDQDSYKHAKQGITDRPSTNNQRSYGTGSENYDKVASEPASASSEYTKMQLPGFKPFRAPTESQPEEGSQEELFNLSVEVDDQAKEGQTAQKIINREQDLVNNSATDGQVGEVAQQQNSMISQEEPLKGISNSQLPDFDNSQQNQRQPSHEREVQQFDVQPINNNNSILSSDVCNQIEMAIGNQLAQSTKNQFEENDEKQFKDYQQQEDEDQSQRESGVEQYESSDGLQGGDASRSSPNTAVPPPAQFPISSIVQQSSQTKDDVTLLEKSERSANAGGITSNSKTVSEARDSMAFQTIQPVNMDASLNEDTTNLMMDADNHQDSSSADKVCQRENTMNVTQMELPDGMGDTTQNICVTDESIKRNLQLRNPQKHDLETGSDGDLVVATMRSKEALEDEVIIGTGRRGGPESLHIFSSGSHLVQTGDHDTAEARRTLEPGRSSSFDIKVEQAEVIDSQRSQKAGAEKAAFKTSKLKRKKRRSNGSPSTRVKKSKSSRSPPRDRPKMIIQQGKMIATNYASRDSSFEKHQFPIRKANFDDSSVARILLGRGQFRDSARLMHKMKTRLSQYNKDVLTHAQQYYYAIQKQQISDNFRMMDDQPVGLTVSMQGQQDSIEVPSEANNRSKLAMTPTGADDVNMISFEDQQSHIVGGTQLPQRNAQRIIQKSDEHLIEGNEINNIQVETSSGKQFEAKRLSSSQHALLQHDNRGLNGSEVLRNNLLTDFQNKSIEPSFQQTTDAVVRNMMEKQQMPQPDHSHYLNKMPSKTSKKMKDRRSAGNQNNNSVSNNHKNNMTPSSQSDMRFRKNRQNRRLILVDNVNGNNLYSSQNASKLYDHPEYSSMNAEVTNPHGQQNNQNIANSGHRSVAISSICQYPQDNLSMLLQAANMQNQSTGGSGVGIPTNQILRANLASRFAHNQLAANRQMSQKYQTVDKLQKKVHSGNQSQFSQNNRRAAPAGLAVSHQNTASDQFHVNKRTSSSHQSLDNDSNVGHNYQTTGAPPSMKPPHHYMMKNRKQAAARQKQRGIANTPGSHNSQQSIALASSSRMQNVGYNRAKYDSTQPTTLAANSQEPTILHTQQARSQTERDHESAEYKFHKWLQKAAPRGYQQQLTSSTRGGAVNQQYFDQDQISAYEFNNPMPQSQQILSEEDAPAILAINQMNETTQTANTATTNQNQEEKKINLSMALKFLNDPSYGQTIAQRKANLKNYIEKNFPEEIQQMKQSQQQRGAHMIENNLNSSSFEENKHLRNVIERRQAIEHQREAEKALIQQNKIDNNLLMHLGPQSQQTNINIRSLPQISAGQSSNLLKINQQLHMARQAVDYSTASNARKKSSEKLDSLSQIYAAMSNSGGVNNVHKRRTIQLKNNYTNKLAIQGGGAAVEREISAATGSNVSNQQHRGSYSPKPANNARMMILKKRQTVQEQKNTINANAANQHLRYSLSSNQQTVSYGKTGVKTHHVNSPSSNPLRLNTAATNQQRQRTHHRGAESSSQHVVAKNAQHRSRKISTANASDSQQRTLNAKVKAKRHKHHVQNVLALEREDTYEHPQISLSMPQASQSQEQDDDDLDVVELPQSLQQQQPSQQQIPAAVAITDTNQQSQSQQTQVQTDNSQVVIGTNTDVDPEIDNVVEVDNMEEQQEVDATDATGYDVVQEHDVVESVESHKEDVPQVLAENDRIPNDGEQVDQIVGEQTIQGDAENSGDRQRYVVSSGGGVPSAAPAPNNNAIVKPSSFRLELDSDQDKKSSRLQQSSNNVLSSSENLENIELYGQQKNIKAPCNTREQKVPPANQKQPSLAILQQNQAPEADNNVDSNVDEDDEDYYADDKFVYEDNAEDPSSEDPEQKFLKQQEQKNEEQDSNSNYSDDQDQIDSDIDDNSHIQQAAQIGLLSGDERDRIQDMYGGDTPESNSLEMLLQNQNEAQRRKNPQQLYFQQQQQQSASDFGGGADTATFKKQP